MVLLLHFANEWLHWGTPDLRLNVQIERSDYVFHVWWPGLQITWKMSRCLVFNKISALSVRFGQKSQGPVLDVLQPNEIIENKKICSTNFLMIILASKPRKN